MFRSVVVLLVLIFILGDQAWRPDLAKEREVLSGQVNEAVERLDRLKAERRQTMTERDSVAAGGLPFDKARRFFGEPYRSTEHAVFDYDRRIRHLDEDIARIVAQGQRYSRSLEAIDANGGRRTPIANQLIARLREVAK